MKPATIARTKQLRGVELLGALKQLQGVPENRVLRVCGYVTRTDKGQRRRQPRAFMRAVVQARGTEPSTSIQRVAKLVLWACQSDLPTTHKSQGKSLLRPEVMALARQGIAEYREALLELAR